jgi:tetratricopeptide (TPR) repeat protein
MSASPPTPFDTFSALLRDGQMAEAKGDFTEAVACYDRAGKALPTDIVDTISLRRAQGVLAMNRGNALQKIAQPATLVEAIAAYDAAIKDFETLPYDVVAPFRNHLGGAWLNRGHAFLATNDPVSATDSFERAVSLLELLPLDQDPSFLVNLAGARINLAHVLVPQDPVRAHSLAQAALGVIAPHEQKHPAMSEMSLRIRFILVMTLDERMRRNGAAQPELIAEATDAIDDGLSLARLLETNGIPQLRPLAFRLFRLGTQLYRLHQPHFLGEFVVENLSLPAFAADANFQSAAGEEIDLALAAVQRPQTLAPGSAAMERLLETVRSLREARDQVSRSNPPT